MPELATAELLSVTVTEGTASVHVAAAGEVDCWSAPQLATALTAALTGSVGVVTVDLTAVTFFDSSGVQALAAAYRQAAGTGSRLRVLASGRAVLRPLQLCGLWRLVGIESASTGPALSV